MWEYIYMARDYAFLVYQTAREHPLLVFAVAFVTFVALTNWELYQLKKVLVLKRGTKMSREDYEQEMRANLVLSSGVVDVIDNAYLKGIITNKQRKAKLRSLGKAWNLDDMLVTGLVQLRGRSLKRMIRRRLNSGFWLKPVPDLAKNPPVSPRSELIHRISGLKMFR